MYAQYKREVNLLNNKLTHGLFLYYYNYKNI